MFYAITWLTNPVIYYFLIHHLYNLTWLTNPVRYNFLIHHLSIHRTWSPSELYPLINIWLSIYYITYLLTSNYIIHMSIIKSKRKDIMMNNLLMLNLYYKLFSPRINLHLGYSLIECLIRRKKVDSGVFLFSDLTTYLLPSHQDIQK